jgi:hypothetical protein
LLLFIESLHYFSSCGGLHLVEALSLGCRIGERRRCGLLSRSQVNESSGIESINVGITAAISEPFARRDECADARGVIGR